MRLPLLFLTIALFVLCSGIDSSAEEGETIYGYLEKTVKPGASAQITDSLQETYYIAQDAEAERKCRPLMGKRVILKGIIESSRSDGSYFVKLVEVTEDLKVQDEKKSKDTKK